MEKLFQKSFSVAEASSNWNRGGGSAVSVAYAACTLARKHILHFESIAESTVLLVGAGETIELVAKLVSQWLYQDDCG